MNDKRYIKVDDKIILEVIINNDKSISFNKKCWVIEQYIETLKTKINAPISFWDNYSFFLSFELENDKFVIKDSYLKKDFSINFPNEILEEVKEYFQEVKTYIINFITQVKDKSENFFFYDELLTSSLWLPYITNNVDLFIPSLVHILNNIAKENKDNITFDYSKVCTLFYCTSNYTKVYKCIKDKTIKGDKVSIYDLYNYFKEV